MAEQEHESVDEVVERNVVGMRELLERRNARDQRRDAEPPSTDDPNIPSGEDQLVDEATGSRGSTGGIRNMGGGRS